MKMQNEREPHNEEASLYDLFLSRAIAACGTDGITPHALSSRLGLTKPQVNAWLKRAVAEKRLKKVNKPVRYRVPESQQHSLPL
jgi:hypothetical protein